MSNQVYIPPINFNEIDNLNSSSVTKINAVEPLEYNKLNSQLSIKAASESNYGVITTGDQNIKGNKNFVDGLTLTSGTILTTPTNDTDITNKNYVDSSFTNNISTADLVKYDTSTNYLINNKTDSNITNLTTNSLNVSDNYINKEPNTVLVRTRGAAGTFDKNITIYKSILNGKISIIFDKNLDFNSYSNVTDVSISKNGIVFNLTDMSNISEIYDYLPNEFELTGEVSTYGGTKNIATKTLKFVKSPTDLYKYDLQYDQSFPFNIFKLKETIKNIDTIISSSEIQKINTLTIEKGYLYNTPTEDNNLVNKSYVDNVETGIYETIPGIINNINSINLTNGTISTDPLDELEIANKRYVDNVKSELNGNINNVETELNASIDELRGSISSAVNNLKIENVSLTTGTISTDPANESDITNKKYVDSEIINFYDVVTNNIQNSQNEINTIISQKDQELRDYVIGEINNIQNVDLTTGTIERDPVNENDITNKKYVDDLKSYSDSNFVKYDSESSKLIKSSQNIDNLNISNLTSETSTINNLTSTTSTISNISISDTITMAGSVADIAKCESNIENYQGDILAACTVNILKVVFNNKYFVKVSLNFSPFVTVEKTFPQYYIKHLDIPRCGTSQIIQHSYFYKPLDETGNFSSTLSVGRFHLHFYNGTVSDNEDKYIIQLGNDRLEGDTDGYIIGNNQKVFWIPDFILIYDV